MNVFIYILAHVSHIHIVIYIAYTVYTIIYIVHDVTSYLHVVLPCPTHMYDHCGT